MSRTLALLACTKSKLSKASPASELYSASQGFRLAYEFARRQADDILILSAKHGAVRPVQVLEPYNETLKGASHARKREWAAAVHAALVEMREYDAASNVLWLAGRDYYSQLLPLLEKDGKRSRLPLAHMPQGKQRQWLRRQLADVSRYGPQIPKQLMATVRDTVVPLQGGSIKEFTNQLRTLVGDAERVRPLICDGNPLTCTVALIGANPGTTTPFWRFWDDERGMDREGWIENYKLAHEGKFRRSRAAIERFVPQVGGRVIELNAHVVYSKRMADLAKPLRTTQLLEFVLGAVRPKIIICAGADASRAVSGMALAWQPKMVNTKHFIYWGKDSERRLAAKVNRML